jgi:hypothetical protein
VKRATVPAFAAVLTALAIVAPASASAPSVHGTTLIPGNKPLEAFASIGQPVALFGDAITAKVAVVVDRKWVDPANVRVRVHFAPYQPISRPAEVQTGSGRLQQLTWTWTIRCLTVDCLPVTTSSELSRDFRLVPARVQYRLNGSTDRLGLRARFQRIQVGSQLNPKVVFYLEHKNILAWQVPLTPVSDPHYRVSPSHAFWLSIALSIVLGSLGLALAGRWAWQFRPSRAAQGPAIPASSLERALTLFFWARANDDDTLQRKALERVADELPFDVHDLSETAHALAWSPEAPDEEDVQVISEAAGIHRRNGESEQ